VKFSRAFTVKGNIEEVFDLCERYVPLIKFGVKRIVKPTLLIVERGNISSSISSFRITEVKTRLVISFAQEGDDVHVKCDYETLYGRLITRRDETTLEKEAKNMKNFVQTALQSQQTV